MKNRKHKKGVTLIELIVGMMMFSIITASAAAVLIPVLKVYARANALAECNTLLDNTANQIIKDLSNATLPIDLTDPKEIPIIIDSSEIVYTIKDGILLRNGEPVVPKAYYNNKSIDFSCTRIPDIPNAAYTLTVIVLSDSDGEMTRREYAVKPLALNQYN